jgi:hypothetical protein
MTTHQQRRRVMVWLGSLALILPLLVGTPARAAISTTVLEWNAHTLSALLNPPTATPPGAGMASQALPLHIAIVQGAVYDAVNAIDGGFEPYLEGLPEAPPGASQDAAAATAAHDVLVRLSNPVTGALLLPQATIDWLDDALATTLAGVPAGSVKDDGVAIGAAAADAMLRARSNDGRFTPGISTVEGTEAGAWRPTSGINDPFAWVRVVQPFVVDSASQFRTDGPNALTSAAYAEEFDEVARLGSASSTERSPSQTAVALFFTANPFELWNRTFRTIAADRGLTPAEQARLLAMLNITSADATINCWDDKAYWHFWRPVTAIHLAGDDGNPATVADPTWTPLVTTPPYPDHPSGYNCNTGAFMHIAKTFFHANNVDFSVVNTTLGTTRTYHRFTDVLKDTIDARIYLGIHFRTADVQAVVLGKQVAHWVSTHAFQPVGQG